VSIQDSGSYEPHGWGEDEVIATFGRERVVGGYAIFRTGGKDWPFHRMEHP
jgi:bifunctional non-homologous end joining protein LigD